jgi:hypothetical protein
LAANQREVQIELRFRRLAAKSIADFARDTDGATPEIVRRLATYGGRQWQRKLRNSLRDIQKVRAFMSLFQKADEVILTSVSQFEVCEWWKSERDLALLNAINEFGQLVVTTWIVDPERPFRSHIPADLVEDIEKAAEMERLKGRQAKPKEVGDLGFLFKDKLRITMALFVVKYVLTHKDRRMRPIQPRFKCPYHCSATTQVLSLGQFPSREAPFPVGYTAQVFYLSPVTFRDQCWYEATIGFPDVVTVKMLVDRFLVFQAHGCNSPLEQIVAAVHRPKEKMLVPPNGMALMGMTHPVIADALQKMKQIAPFATVPVPMLGGGGLGFSGLRVSRRSGFLFRSSRRRFRRNLRSWIFGRWRRIARKLIGHIRQLSRGSLSRKSRELRCDRYCKAMKTFVQKGLLKISKWRLNRQFGSFGNHLGVV